MYDLTKYNGLNLKSEASEVFSFETEEDLIKILTHAEDKQRELQVIGSGTNTIFPRYFSKIVIIAFLIQNLTNDLIYSPDASLFLFICISFLVSGYYSSISKFSVAKS